MSDHVRVPLRVAIRRGLRKRCPRCGDGPLFEGWYTIRESCPACALPFDPTPGGTWAFMYLSTAFMTGVIVVGMLMIHPPNMWIGRVGIFAAVMLFIIGTMPYRKGIAIAIDYFGHPERDAPPKAPAE